MIKRLIFGIALLSLSSIVLLAQESISGTISDRESGLPIANASVFIDNSMAETTTDEEGKFVLENVPPGFKQLIATHAEHKTYKGKISGIRILNIRLAPDALKKDIATNKPAKSRKWKRLYQQFEKAFLGNTANAKRSIILNPEVLEFERDNDGTIWGYSVGLVQIENQALGYNTFCQLDKIEIRNKLISVTGHSYFSDMEPSSSGQENEWVKNRELTYLGSRPHFLFALSSDKLEELGYQIFDAAYDESGAFTTLDEFQASDVLKDNTIKFNEFLRVVYTKNPAEAGYRSQSSSSVSVPNDSPRGQVVRGGLLRQPVPESDLRVSYLFNRASKIVLNEQAQTRNPEYLIEYGYWNWERIAQVMPIEYHLAYMAKHN